MRKALLLLAIILSVAIWSCNGSSGDAKTDDEKTESVKKNKTYLPGEKEAEDVIKAYQDRDLEKLKSYVSGMFKMVMKDGFFEGMDSYLERIDDWDGEIREVRYDMQEVTFEKTYYAKVHFSEDPDNNERLYLIVVKSKDKKKWNMSSNGLSTINKEKYKKLSESLSDDKVKK